MHQKELSGMRIPVVGEDVLWIAVAAIREGDKVISKAVVRPAKVIQVEAYSPEGSRAALSIFVNGNLDSELMSSLERGAQPYPTMIWRAQCEYDRKGERSTGWMFYEDYYGDTSHSIEQIMVNGEITHGRETIADQAIGIWDQSKNTISFRRESVDGLADSHEPVYPADSFIDQHCVRLLVPEKYQMMIKMVQTDHKKESPDERRRYIRNFAWALERGIDPNSLTKRELAGMPPSEFEQSELAGRFKTMMDDFREFIEENPELMKMLQDARRDGREHQQRSLPNPGKRTPAPELQEA